MDQQISKTIIAVPPGSTHAEIVINKATGEVVGVLHYAEGELKELFLKIGHALGLNKPMEPTEPPAQDPPAA
jgi:hypothetical protein